jgi:ABC-type branched-subunit amino acid transport system substrate-binding protein
MLALHEPIPLAVEGRTVAGEAAEYDERRDAARWEEEPADPAEPLAAASATATDRQPDALAGEPLAGPVERVACLVQLTGPDKDYGWRALNGLRLAFEDLPDSLAVRDTGGDPQVAAQLVRRLAADPTVLAVVGPQRSAESEAVAPLAEQLGLPVLLLSQREGLGGRAVLQAGVTQRQQAGTVIDYASTRLGVRRFGVLYPDDGYGRAFVEAFGAEVQQRGGTLVGKKSYPAGNRSFGGEIAAVRGWIDAGGLQAVFIPDAAPTATALATALRQVAPELVLLGSESWNDAPLIAQAGSAIDGAVFVDTFYPGGGDAGTEAFVSRFRSRAGTSPTVFEAQAYDAGMLVRRAIEQGGSTRSALLEQLRAVRSYEGAGRLSAAPHGFERELILLRAHHGEIQRIEPAAG